MRSPGAVQHLRYVDALRGLAILGVLLVHCGQYGSGDRLMPALFRTVTSQGQLGVQLFFIVSAFTLFLSFKRRVLTERRPIVNFFIRRFSRVAPMYYLGILAYLWLDGRGPRYWLGSAESITTGNIVSNFTFVHGFNPYWINSLVPGGWAVAVEMLFYCLVPVLVLRIANRRHAFNFLLFTLFLRLGMEVLLSRAHPIPDAELWGKYLKLYLPSQLPVFALGILMYFLVVDDADAAARDAISPAAMLLAAVVVISQAALGIHILPAHVMSSIAFVVFAVALSRQEWKILVNPVFTHLGKVSFSLYLVHIAVLHGLARFGGADYLPVTGGVSAMLNYLIRLGLLLVASVAAATVLQKLVERPTQRLGTRLIAVVEARRLPRVGVAV